MYWEATQFYNQYKKDKCKYWTYLSRLWRWMSKESSIQNRDFHRMWVHDKNGQTCPRCFEYKWWDWFYNCKTEKSGKDNVCSDCRKRYAKFRWSNNPEMAEKQRVKRLALKCNLV